MSNKTNDIVLENFKDRFEEIRQDKQWSKLTGLYRDMEDAGFGKEEVELSHTLEDEEIAEIRKVEKIDNEMQNQ